MNQEYNIDPIVWFGKRELPYTPPHFVVVKTPITQESKLWILSNLRGRFSLCKQLSNDSDTFNIMSTVIFNEGYPAFEDPKEAVLFELKWS